MSGIEIIDKYPLSVAIIKEWYYNKMLEALTDKSISEEFAKYMLEPKIIEKNLIDVLDKNQRSLFDVFDENNIFIEIFLYLDNTFTVKIGNYATTKSWKTRKEADLFAIEAAFDILENQLNIK